MTSGATLRMVVLGSGSAGNAIAVTDQHTTVLIDCGFSARETARRLESAQIVPSSVAAVLLTHEHGDHVRGVDVFVRRHAPNARICATSGTLRASGLEASEHDRTIVARGEYVRIGTLDVLPFVTSHDAAEPVGFRIESGTCAVGVMTDTGRVTPEALEALAGCVVLGLESNHDVAMLESGPYPVHLKRRIRSQAGHLSNEAAADALELLAHDGLTHLVALHRSRTNNTAELVQRGLRERAALIGLAAQVIAADQQRPCDTHPPQDPLFDVSA